MMCNVSGVKLKYTVQMWSNATKTWRDSRCRYDNANGLCVVRALNTNVTVTGLTPGHAYYFRFVSPSLQSSQISESMVTKQLGKTLCRIICDSLADLQGFAMFYSLPVVVLVLVETLETVIISSFEIHLVGF